MIQRLTAQQPLPKRYGHVLSPRFSYRGLPYQSASTSAFRGGAECQLLSSYT